MRRFLVLGVVSLLLGNLTIKGQTIFGEEQIISTDANGAVSVYTADLDGDGDKDVLSASEFDDKIAWYKNDGSGNFSTEIIISIDAQSVQSVYATDLDSDGDIDVLSASEFDKKLAWYENDGMGNFEEKIIVQTNPMSSKLVYAADLDGDGDMDIISGRGNRIEWYENDGAGQFSGEILIASNAMGLSSIFSADLDNDGDVDVLSSSSNDDKIAWYENDGNGDFSINIIISANADGATSVYAQDLDGDGDIDVLSASSWDDKVAWYENDGNGNFGEEIIISTDVSGAISVFAADLDEDGDIDALSAFFNEYKIAWYENDGSGNFSEEIIISANAWNANCVYAEDLDGDGDMDVLSASYTDDKIAWYENTLEDILVNSFVFQDINKNGLYEINEPQLANQKLIFLPSSKYLFSNSEGNTPFFIRSGEYQLTYEPNLLWEITTSPDTYDVTVTENAELPIYYFGFKPTRTLTKVEPNINSSPTRCSREATYWLHYSNTGTTLANGTITLEVDKRMGFISFNPEPDLIEEQTLTWNFTNLNPSFENKIELQFQMPDFNSIGEILKTQASLQLFNENEELIYSKSIDYNSEVLCSYDPNDKLVRSNLLGQSETAYISDTLLYTIRFQNTGNDVAFNIRIEDILDKKLDWTTFHPITASHGYRSELNRETGLVTFYFDDIMLPDSTSNESESHGFVLFGIASLPDIGDKTEVENTASIFFDFNPPIITNTVSTVLIELDDVGVETLEGKYAINVYPNPFSDYTMIEVEGLPQGDYRLEVLDILGRKVQILTLENGKARLERGKLESGVYFFRALEKGNLEEIGGGKVLVE